MSSDRHLQTLSDALQAFAASSTDYPRLLCTVAERMANAVGDGCAICLVSEDKKSLRVATVHHRDPAVAQGAKVFAGSALTIDSEKASALVARTGNPLVLPHVDVAVLAKHFGSEVAAFLAQTGVRSILFVPLLVSGAAIGTAVLGRSGPEAQPFDEHAVSVAQTIASGAALAISNARVLDSLRQELDERKRAEEQTKRFVALVQHSNDLIAMATLSGEVLFINQAGRDLLGMGPDEQLPLEKFHTAEGMQRAPILREQGRWEGEGVLRHARTGALIPTQISSFLLRDANDEPMGYATVQRDLRPMRRLEQHMRQMQKMDAIGRLAAGVAHDFNNMLSIILSYGSLLLESLAEESPVRPEIDEMIGAARRASQLTQQLLAFSRQQVLEPRIANMNEIVSGIERMARRLLREDVLLTTSLDPGIGSVRVDVGQMEQVILNLAANARDAMPQGGSLKMATGQTTVGAESDLSVAPGRYVTLEVSDTGVGMDEATLGRLFEPFFTTKAPGAGTGLGLATVFGIVKQSGGHVAVSSRVGAGTTVTIYLPVHEEGDRSANLEAASPRPPPRTRGDGARETILLVEDEARVRKLMERVLRKEGYAVIEAASANAALEAIGKVEERIDLLLTDVVMPRLSGPQLAARFVASRPGAKVLYVSGYMDVTTIDVGLEFLRKPFTPEGLLKRVRDVLDGVSSLTSASLGLGSQPQPAASRFVPPSSS